MPDCVHYIDCPCSKLTKQVDELSRHLNNIFQDRCEEAFVEASICDAFQQALYEVAPEHPCFKGEPPNFGVWATQRKQLTEAQTKLAEAVGILRKVFDTYGILYVGDFLSRPEIEAIKESEDCK